MCDSGRAPQAAGLHNLVVHGFPDSGLDYGGNGLAPIRWRRWWLGSIVVATLVGTMFALSIRSIGGLIVGIVVGVTVGLVTVLAPLQARGYVLPGQPRLVVGYGGMRIYLTKTALLTPRPYVDLPWSAVKEVRLVGEPPTLVLDLTKEARSVFPPTRSSPRPVTDVAPGADGLLVVPDVIAADLPHSIEHYSGGKRVQTGV
jgi:hypothetical protein